MNKKDNRNAKLPFHLNLLPCMIPDPTSRAVTGSRAHDAVHHLGHRLVVHGPQGEPHSVLDVAFAVVTLGHHNTGHQYQKLLRYHL